MPILPSASRQGAHSYGRLVSFDITIVGPVQENADYTLSSTTDAALIVPPKTLNFSGLRQPVLVVLSLVNHPEVRFPDNPYKAIGFAHGEQCPDNPHHGVQGMFHDLSVDTAGRRLAFIDVNPGGGGLFSFTLFLDNSDGVRVGSIDPMMIND